MGLSVSDAVRMMLVRVAAEDALPFEVRVPNSTTVKAMEDRRPWRRKALQLSRGSVEGLGCGFQGDADQRSELMSITVPK